MRRWIMLLVLASLAVATFAPAHAGVPDPTCTLAQTTVDECQGPDHAPEGATIGPILFGQVPDPDGPYDGCRIGVWVGTVTCSGLLPPDGTGSTVNGLVTAYNDAGQTATLTVTISDETTGQVLNQWSASSANILSTPVGPVAFVGIQFGSFYGYSANHPVTIQAVGTHAAVGAQTAAIAALDLGYWDALGVGPKLPNNYIQMYIN